MILDKICFGDNEHSSISFLSVGRGYSSIMTLNGTLFTLFPNPNH